MIIFAFVQFSFLTSNARQICTALLLLCLSTALAQSALAATNADSATIPLDSATPWISTASDVTNSLAWGDVDGDGDLDLAVGNDHELLVYGNTNGRFAVVWRTAPTPHTRSLAWGDVDGDGDLDLAVGDSSGANRLYLNDGARLQLTLAWSSNDRDATFSVAWGDVDGDGDLDLAVGNQGAPNKLYRNEQGQLNPVAVWQSVEADDTRSVAWGDVDGDGDLDLAVGNGRLEAGAANRLYRNEGGQLQATAIWSSVEAEFTTGVAWGDVDGDGDLDLATANWTSSTKVYLNYDGALATTAGWLGAERGFAAYALAWGDADNDGDLDLALARSSGPSLIYRNEGNALNPTAAWSSADNDVTLSLAWGDADGDGDLDLAVGNGGANKVYWNMGRPLAPVRTLLPGNQQQTLAWGDVDGDGDPDLALGGNGLPVELYRNDQGLIQPTPIWRAATSDNSHSLAWGDVDGDGDLDLAAGNAGGPNRLYRNEQGQLNPVAVWQSVEAEETRSVAWGDVDGDGDIDLAAGNFNALLRLYRNDGGQLTPTAFWSAAVSDLTTALAWGDVDGDGDLDLAVANDDTPNKLYHNTGHGLDPVAGQTLGGNESSFAVAWGDADGDGDLDLAFGNYRFPNQLYRNVQGVLQAEAAWSSADSDATLALAWGDADGDGDLDLAAGNGGSTSGGVANKLYLNQNGTLQPLAGWHSTDEHHTLALAWVDLDGDGDLELSYAGGERGNAFYLNQKPVTPFVTTQAGKVPAANAGNRAAIALAPSTAPGNDVATTITLSYTLYHPQGEPFRTIRAFYSLDGGDAWRPALPTADTPTSHLASSPYPAQSSVNQHRFTWDVPGSGFFGQSDNVLVRLEALPRLQPQANSVPGPFLHGRIATQSGPLRIRGSQVQIHDAANSPRDLSGALVYRQPAGERGPAQPIVDGAGRPYVTTAQGWLQGRGALQPHDQLVALLPVTATANYTLYHTSAAPTETGVAAFSVTAPGVQRLVVSSAHPLLLFNLTVALEWDARADQPFLTRLAQDLERTAQILYDLTDGQATLGRIDIYQNREQWQQADIVIHAGNRVRPSAILGGVVVAPRDDVDRAGRTISGAYLPGQVRMPPTWSRFGEAGQETGEDWPRVLAHELGHYLFFLPDNYLGFDDAGQLIFVDCKNSIMTEPYDGAYSEFVTPAQAAVDSECQKTVAIRAMGRADWATIQRFYPMLQPGRNLRGPTTVPLAVTQLNFIAPTNTAQPTFPAPYLHLTDENGSPLAPAVGRTQSYLLKPGATDNPADDQVINLGSAVGNLLYARGAAAGDTLCVLVTAATGSASGCQRLDETVSTLRLQAHDWQPDVQVTPLATTTVVVTIDPLPAPMTIEAQLLPAFGPASAVSSQTVDPAVNARYEQTLSAPDGAYFGHIRLRLVDAQGNARTLLTDYMGYGGWDGKAWAWGGKAWAWGGKAWAWGAPLMSGDGQVSIFPVENPLGQPPAYTLQPATAGATLPTWLYPVGQAFRLQGSPGSGRSAILFRYLSADLPQGGLEKNLRIYHAPADGGGWQPLPSLVNGAINHISAPVAGDGLYLVGLTATGQALAAGCNTFTYSLDAAPAAPATALASIAGAYTAVYGAPVTGERGWRLYDATVAATFAEAAQVNTLQRLEPGESYQLYVTRPVTLYQGLPTVASGAVASGAVASGVVASGVVASGGQVESAGATAPTMPATYYGWITPTLNFQPSAGMIVTATINGVVRGQTMVQAVNGKLLYVLPVEALDLSQRCGVTAQTVHFAVGGCTMNETRAWDNRQAWLHGLTTPTALCSPTLPAHRLLLPLIRQGG